MPPLPLSHFPPSPCLPLALPPSERDFEIFFAVAFQSVSTRRTAELHKISQTRVRQVVALVGDWVAENLPAWDEADLKKQVRLAQHVAANRLEHQYEQAMNYWNAEGDPKYLRQATRIALAQARLGVVAGRIHALAADVTAGPAELSDDLRGAGLRPAAAPAHSDPSTTSTRRVSEGPPCGADIPVCHAPTRSIGEGPDVGCISEAQCTTGASSTTPPDPCLLTPDPLPEDCSPFADNHPATDLTDDDDPALTDSPETLIDRERQERLNDVEGLSLMERRLLTLIDNEGSANSERVTRLRETLSRVRASKATAELRLSRFTHGIHIEPLS